MKKLLLAVLLLISTNVYATEVTTEEPIPSKKEVTLVKCTSTSNIWFNIDGKHTRVTLIAFDKEDGELNKDIDLYVCTKLSNSKIEIEYDENITSNDKYNRLPLWIYVDGTLLQSDLIEKGYGQVNNIQGDYKYLTNLCELQKQSISSSLGIWNYKDIKEVYCKSGISVGEKIEEEVEIEEEIDKYDIKKLYFILVLDSGIVLLLLLNRKKK